MSKETEVITVPEGVQLHPTRWYWDCPVCYRRRAVSPLSSGKCVQQVVCGDCGRVYNVVEAVSDLLAACERYVRVVESNAILHAQVRESAMYNMFKDAIAKAKPKD